MGSRSPSWSSSASGLGGRLSQAIDRRVGTRAGEVRRAISTSQAALLFTLILTTSFVVFYATYDLAELRGLVVANVVAAALLAIGLLFARLGRQLVAATLALGVPALQIVTSTAVLGWEAGFHLYLLCGAQLVYMVFTERQRSLRWLWASIALAAFLFCQFQLPVASAMVPISATVLVSMFSLNVVLAGALIFVLAAISHVRAEHARSEAGRSAARAEYLANTDALTGLATRRPVIERLAILDADPTAQYSLAIADLDSFKELNDTYGHGCGDRVLTEVGVRLRSHLRVTDSVGRWGGEEFILVLPDAELADAERLMERVRTAIGGVPLTCDGHDHRISVSIGLTEAEGQGAEPAIRRADNAMYEAKRSGRDRVCAVAAPVLPHPPAPIADPAPPAPVGAAPRSARRGRAR